MNTHIKMDTEDLKKIFFLAKQGGLYSRLGVESCRMYSRTLLSRVEIPIEAADPAVSTSIALSQKQTSLLLRYLQKQRGEVTVWFCPDRLRLSWDEGRSSIALIPGEEAASSPDLRGSKRLPLGEFDGYAIVELFRESPLDGGEDFLLFKEEKIFHVQASGNTIARKRGIRRIGSHRKPLPVRPLKVHLPKKSFWGGVKRFLPTEREVGRGADVRCFLSLLSTEGAKYMEILLSRLQSEEIEVEGRILLPIGAEEPSLPPVMPWTGGIDFSTVQGKGSGFASIARMREGAWLEFSEGACLLFSERGSVTQEIPAGKAWGKIPGRSFLPFWEVREIAREDVVSLRFASEDANSIVAVETPTATIEFWHADEHTFPPLPEEEVLAVEFLDEKGWIALSPNGEILCWKGEGYPVERGAWLQSPTHFSIAMHLVKIAIEAGQEGEIPYDLLEVLKRKVSFEKIEDFLIFET
jgi:hypothetical protein